MVVIMDGDVKMELALRMSANAVEKGLYEDLKIVFWGPSQEKLLYLSGEPKDNFERLLKRGAVDSACINYAKAKGIEERLRMLGVPLEPAGERIAHYVGKGYQVLVF